MRAETPWQAGRPDAQRAAAHREAMQWQVVLWSGEVTAAERRDFEVWLQADALHRDAWEQLQQMGRRLQAVPAAIASPVLRTSLAARGQRRAVVRGMAGLAVVGLAAYGLRQTPQWDWVVADMRTGVGERREHLLPDGTRLLLNTRSAVDLRFDVRERRLLLLTGELFVATGPAAVDGRPLLVETAEGVVRPVGTRFVVRRLESAAPTQVLVQVLAGAVDLLPRDGGGPVRVGAGYKAGLTRAAALAPQTADAAEVAWLRGMLVAERMRLEDFVAELARYRHGVLRCDPAVAGLTVSGVFPLSDTDAILQSVAQALPVRLRSVTRYWVTVAAR